MNKTPVYRHGEILFKKIKELPGDIKKSATKTILTGSNNNPHTFKGGELYLKKIDDYVFGYFKADNTTLYHTEHGEGGNKLKVAKLPNGVYELRRAVERVNNELKPVID